MAQIGYNGLRRERFKPKSGGWSLGEMIISYQERKFEIVIKPLIFLLFKIGILNISSSRGNGVKLY